VALKQRLQPFEARSRAAERHHLAVEVEQVDDELELHLEPELLRDVAQHAEMDRELRVIEHRVERGIAVLVPVLGDDRRAARPQGTPQAFDEADGAHVEVERVGCVAER